MLIRDQKIFILPGERQVFPLQAAYCTAACNFDFDDHCDNDDDDISGGGNDGNVEHHCGDRDDHSDNEFDDDQHHANHKDGDSQHHDEEDGDNHHHDNEVDDDHGDAPHLKPSLCQT